MIQLNATHLGLVEAEQCQAESYQSKPNQNALISQLKLKAQQLGGNGLVFDRCIQNSNTFCHAHLRCQGLAIKVTR